MSGLPKRVAGNPDGLQILSWTQRGFQALQSLARNAGLVRLRAGIQFFVDMGRDVFQKNRGQE